MKKPPVIIGNVDTSNDPVLQYSKGVAERTAAARRNKPPVGDLAQANEGYDPRKNAPMTIGQILSTQKAVDQASGSGGLSAESVKVMKAVAEASSKARAQKEQIVEETKPVVAAPPVIKPAPAATTTKSAATEVVDALDDFEIERLMRSIQNDVINNEKEKSHVNDTENRRLSEIDFAAGIADGEFTQIVDVVPGKLKVHYRSVTAMENQAIRLWIFKRVAEDERLDRISGEMFGLGLLVASVVQIGGSKYPDHLKRSGQGVYSAQFDDDGFALKYSIFSRMPQPLIHAMGTHGQWFDERVRKLFTTDFVKNG